MNEKAIGFDLGTKTLGIAYSDSLGIVHGIETFRFPEMAYSRAKKRAIEIIAEYGVKEVALGLPRNMDGSDSGMTRAARIFGERLKEALPDIRLAMVDERLTSIEANELMDEAGVKTENKHDVVDMFAAEVILKLYLNGRKK